MARTPKKASKGKRAKKGKIQDLPAGRKAKNVKGGSMGWDLASNKKL